MGRNLVKLGAAIALGGGLFAMLTVQPPNIVFPIFAAGVAIALWGLAPELLDAMLSAREREWLEDPEACHNLRRERGRRPVFHGGGGWAAALHRQSPYLFLIIEIEGAVINFH